MIKTTMRYDPARIKIQVLGGEIRITHGGPRTVTSLINKKYDLKVDDLRVCGYDDHTLARVEGLFQIQVNLGRHQRDGIIEEALQPFLEEALAARERLSEALDTVHSAHAVELGESILSKAHAMKITLASLVFESAMSDPMSGLAWLEELMVHNQERGQNEAKQALRHCLGIYS